jgi:AAA domain-containing protein
VRLLRIRLTDFRGVHDREIHLAEQGVTVLEGDNEVGKTSTISALDLLVDFRDSSTAAEVRAAAPSGRDAGPTVEAELVSGPYHVVYRKRWLRRKLTELTVLAPRAEQLTGREAHERMLGILDETMDRNLWRALRVEQHTPLGQADLGGQDALTRALDRAASGASGASEAAPGADAAAEDLVERALAEARRYLGGHHRPVGPLREAKERLAAAQVEADAAALAVEEVERDVALRADLDREASSLAVERQATAGRAHELEDRWTAFEARRLEVDAAAERAGAARERARRATDRQAERARLIERAAEATRAADAAGAAIATQEERDAARRADADERRAGWEAARAAAAEADTASRAADDALALARDHAELADLSGRLRRAEAAEAARREVERASSRSRVDAAAVEDLEQLDRQVVRAEAELAAGAGTVEVVAHDAGSGVTADGEAVAPGQTRTVPVAGPVTVGVPGVVEVRVRPGLDGAEARRRVARAHEERDAACAALGVADLAAARAARHAAEDAAGRVRELTAVVERELGGRPTAEVRAEVDRLAERLRPAPAAPSAGKRKAREQPVGPALFDDPALVEDQDEPDDAARAARTVELDTLRRDAGRARDAAATARRAAEEAEQGWRLADDAVRAAESEVAAARTGGAVARSDASRLATELADARAAAPDASLDAEATDTLARARRTEADHEQRAAALAADDPDTVEALVVSARRATEALTTRSAEVERRRAEVTGRLQMAGGEGRYDRLTAARDDVAAAEREHASVARRAAAAVRLHTTLARHRDEVRQAYVAPFRREVERLARIVFGPSLALEVDQGLRIVARTLNGVTVPFEALSSGAKEQLGLCARLAVAALVDAQDGVPVMIDDALGHSDPARLERLAAVFTAATTGATHQVVVLTCSPARYRGIGATRTVALSPSLPPPTAVPSPTVEDPGETAADEAASAGSALGADPLRHVG